jgi:DNA-binding CsgD family transcriptional regulator
MVHPAGTPRRRRRWQGPGGLTRRELEVLSLVARGLTNRAVGRSLWVTDETVKFHLSNIYRKLGVSNRAEASRWAVAAGVAISGETAHHSGTTTS